jgi:hypothetical protein
MKNKTIENEKINDKIFNTIIHFAGTIFAAALIIIGIYCGSEENNKTNKGTYHDYNKAIIIYGKNDGIVIDLAGYDHVTLGTERYELYSTDGKQYSASPDDVILYNDTE